MSTPELFAGLPDFAVPLLEWYDAGARVLPWRSDPTPYRVWVSEIMLQQTRVSAVIPYFQRFLARLPDIRSLAECPPDELMKLWEGLGYYSRARNLQKAAQMVMREHGGRLPETPEGLKTLPGIGEYTASAIASIAFGNKTPCVDGNVLRVCARLAGEFADIARTDVKAALALRLMNRIPEDRPGDFNQALMELGAMVCVPNGAPLCADCPVEALCVAGGGLWQQLPVKSPKPQKRQEEWTVFVLWHDGKTAVFKRPEKGLLAGTWQLPAQPELLEADEAQRWLEENGARVQQITDLGSFTHVFTHVRWRMRGYAAKCIAPPDIEAVKWAEKAEMTGTLAFGRPFSEFLARARDFP